MMLVGGGCSMCGMAKKRKRGRPRDPHSKRSKGVDRHQGTRKAIYLDAELLAAMERYITMTEPTPSEAAVIRLALKRLFREAGCLPPKGK